MGKAFQRIDATEADLKFVGAELFDSSAKTVSELALFGESDLVVGCLK
jgi:hypothetical protein